MRCYQQRQHLSSSTTPGLLLCGSRCGVRTCHTRQCAAAKGLEGGSSLAARYGGWRRIPKARSWIRLVSPLSPSSLNKNTIKAGAGTIHVCKEEKKVNLCRIVQRMGASNRRLCNCTLKERCAVLLYFGSIHRRHLMYVSNPLFSLGRRGTRASSKTTLSSMRTGCRVGVSERRTK